MNINDIDAEKRLCKLEDGLKVMKEKLFDGLDNLTDEESRMCVNHRRLKIKEREELIRKTENELLDRMKEMVQHISSMMEKPDEYRLTDKDIQVGQAITMLLSEWERMYMEMCCENEKGVSKKFTKNTVMYYLRETTCLSTNDVRKSLKKYKNEYASLKKKVIG